MTTPERMGDRPRHPSKDEAGTPGLSLHRDGGRQHPKHIASSSAPLNMLSPTSDGVHGGLAALRSARAAIQQLSTLGGECHRPTWMASFDLNESEALHVFTVFDLKDLEKMKYTFEIDFYHQK
jgi:hypothetical protein